MAGSEWPEDSLLLRVEWWDACGIHQMAAPASHLHQRCRALRRYEGAGTACTPLTALQITDCNHPKSLMCLCRDHSLCYLEIVLLQTLVSTRRQVQRSGDIRRRGSVFLVSPPEIPCLVKILIQKFYIKFFPLVSAKKKFKLWERNGDELVYTLCGYHRCYLHTSYSNQIDNFVRQCHVTETWHRDTETWH